MMKQPATAGGSNLSYAFNLVDFPTVLSLSSYWDDTAGMNDTNHTFKCNQYQVENKTYIVDGSYEGIPENLVINCIGWVCLLSLFTLLRKMSWGYGSTPQDRKQEKQQSHVFYGAETGVDNSDPVTGGETDSVSSNDSSLDLDDGIFSWVLALFKIKDEHIRRKSGQDAVHYLSFQRHMIVYLAVVCVVCIVVVLPINFQGSLEGGNQEFGHTTISNLSPSSPFMWAHITLAFLFLPLGIAFTRHHSRQLHLNPTDLDPNDTGSSDTDVSNSFVARTIMITHVPRRWCDRDTLLTHFQEAYPDVEVMEIQFAYSIKDLISKDKDRKVAHRARLYCEDYVKKNDGKSLMMTPYTCGVICSCCGIFGCKKVDALDYYSEEEERLKQEVESERKLSLERPTGVAFVTLDSKENAAEIVNDHTIMTCRSSESPPVPSGSAVLRPQNWDVIHAPAPYNIYWKNLSVRSRSWWAKAILINLFLFVVLFFLTTPAVIMTFLEDFAVFSDNLNTNPVLAEFLPTLLLLAMAALMPVLVAYSDQFMSHWTRSAQNHAVMWKTFVFLLLMVIVLPSLGLTSAESLVEWIAKPTANNGTYRWECIFLPDNGAFFVNYIITSAFLGTSLELIRFPDLFMYIIRLTLIRSKAETDSVRHDILTEFMFGVQYAWMLVIFAMTIIYSLSCPLITPFGLLYMVFKHYVDKYNIYFAYGPSRISKNIHATAVNFMIVSIVLLQLCLFFFAFVRLGITQPRTIYSLTLLCITGLVFISHIGLHCLSNISPIQFENSDVSPDAEAAVDGSSVEGVSTVTASGVKIKRSNSGVETGFYVPDVLKDNSPV